MLPLPFGCKLETFPYSNYVQKGPRWLNRYLVRAVWIRLQQVLKAWALGGTFGFSSACLMDPDLSSNLHMLCTFLLLVTKDRR